MVVLSILGAKKILKILRAPRFKKPFTLSEAPPWAKIREGLAARPATIERVNDAFAEIAHATREFPLSQRMEIISKVMKGKSFGGTKRVRYSRKSPEEVKAKIAELEKIIAKYTV